MTCSMIQHHVQDHEQDTSWASVPTPSEMAKPALCRSMVKAQGGKQVFCQQRPSLLVPDHMLALLQTQAAEAWERVRVIFSAIQLVLA